MPIYSLPGNPSPSKAATIAGNSSMNRSLSGSAQKPKSATQSFSRQRYVDGLASARRASSVQDARDPEVEHKPMYAF